MKPNLYALLVGVNDYRSDSIRDLKGCVADVKRLEAYLNKTFVTRNFKQDPDILALTNKGATKEAVLAGFEKHLGQAKKGDSVLFYFSGHGLREKTDISVFKEDEFDGNISSILCHDSNPKEHATTPALAPISDKELRYQIHKLESKSGANILTIFDCCHSGENTRSMQSQENPLNASRQLERDSFPRRNRDGYSFGKETKAILAATSQPRNLASILPEGKHIQMAACKEVELAMETPLHAEVRKGVFTTCLLDILTQFEGDINYEDLHLRILNSMSTYAQSWDAQTPQMYIKTDDPNHRYRTFLTHEPSDKSLSCNVVLGGQEEDTVKEWRITSGALQGIPVNQEKFPSTVSVKSTLDREGEWPAHIEEVFPGYCRIKFGEASPPEGDATLYGEIEGIGTDPLKIFVGGPDEKGVKFTREHLSSFIEKSTQKLYQLFDKEEEAQYTLFIREGILLCTKPHQHEKPLIKAVAINNSQGEYLPHKMGLVNNDLVQMANWMFIQKLEYSEDHDISAFTDKDKTMYPVELRMFVYDDKKEEETRVFPNKFNSFLFDLTEKDRKRSFRLELVNHSEDDYFCSLLFLSNMFGVTAGIMNSPQQLIGPNQRVLGSKGFPIGGKKYMGFGVDKEEDNYIRDFNLDGLSLYLKLIVSATPFRVETLEMEELPKPEKVDFSKVRSQDRGKNLSFFDFEPDPVKVEWEIHTFELYIQNPDIKPVT